jgi:hypothetical protein
MDIQEIKKKSIFDYLTRSGYKPVNNSGKYRSFYSPFGKEANASFKVNMSNNTWTDYHKGTHGDIIDLVMELEHKEFVEACRFLEDDRRVSVVQQIKDPEPGVKIHRVSEITDTELLDYFVRKRHINLHVLYEYCKQVEFSFPMGKHPDKVHTAVGFSTSMGSYELRNTWFKGGSPPKSFSFVSGESSDVAIWEGFTDFLSLLTYEKRMKPKCNTYILNGVGQYNLIRPFLDGKRVYFYGDNDNASDELLEKMSDLDVVDMRYEYEFYKDFNQMLCDV